MNIKNIDFKNILTNFYFTRFVTVPVIIGLVITFLFGGTYAQQWDFVKSGNFYGVGLFIRFGLMLGLRLISGGTDNNFNIVNEIKNIFGFNNTCSDDVHRRGSKLVDVKNIIKLTSKEKCDLTLGIIPFPREIETRGILFAGMPGSGKTVAMTQLLDGVRERGNRCVVYDIGGQFAEKFYREGKDIILNPLDKRSPVWSIFAEISNPLYDCDRIAKALVPDVPGNSNSQEWNFFAQQTISAILKRMWEKGERTNSDFKHYLSVATMEELGEMVEGTPAARILSPSAKGMASSVLGMLGAYASPFSILPKDGDEKSFSLRKWTEDEDNDSWIFLTVREDQTSLINPLISMWLDCIASTFLSMEENLERRLVFAIDEFASLPRIQSIKSLLEKGRKKGGFPILGMQSISQVYSVYDEADSQTILNCIGTWVALRTPDYKTAEYLSHTFGKSEILRTTESKGHEDSSENNWSQQIATSDILMPSQFTNLHDLEGWTKLSGPYYASSNSWTYKKFPKVAKTFELI